jgi:hypothetical protein
VQYQLVVEVHIGQRGQAIEAEQDDLVITGWRSVEAGAEPPIPIVKVLLGA